MFFGHIILLRRSPYGLRNKVYLKSMKSLVEVIYHGAKIGVHYEHLASRWYPQGA